MGKKMWLEGKAMTEGLAEAGDGLRSKMMRELVLEHVGGYELDFTGRDLSCGARSKNMELLYTSHTGLP